MKLVTWLNWFKFRHDMQDPSWKPTGVKYSFRGHDEALGVASVQHGERLATQRRKLAARRAEPKS